MTRQNDTPTLQSPGHGNLPIEAAIAAVGEGLLATIRGVLGAVGGADSGPQALARSLGLEKVLTSRVLAATRSGDAVTALHRMPGPDPLRRLVRAAAKRGAAGAVIDDATGAIDAYESLIRDRIGDRSLLDAMLASWIPEARREFELRRKQSAFKAMSQIRGVQAEALAATVVLHPAPGGKAIDVVWVNGLIGVHRVRPGARVKVTSRRMSGARADRRPVSLDGKPVEHVEGLLLPEFCSEPTPALEVQHSGEVVHYTLADRGFGPGTGVDVVFAEANLGELDRLVPAGASRKSYFFAEVVTPAKVLQFDVLVHESLYPAGAPELRIYDTAFEGVASANDAARDIDRLEMLETIEALGVGAQRFRSADVPRYSALVRSVFDRMRWDGARFRGYRTRVDYPVYGSQVMMTFVPETGAAGGGA